MYRIYRTRGFKKSFERVRQSGKLKEQVKASFVQAINTLAEGEKLPDKYKDHQLTGELGSLRECHVKGDLLLVYQIRKNELLLILVDIETHSYLGL